MKLVAAFVENKPGQTASITNILASAGVNICWVTIANSGSFGVMKFLVDKSELALDKLRAAGIMVSPLEVVAVETDNKPGGLHGIAALLAQNNINLANCSGFVANNRAIVIIETPEPARAGEVLQKNGLHLLSQAELQKI